MQDDPDTVILPVVEEQVTLGKRSVVTGRVRIETRTETREQVVPVDLSSTDVEVTRVPVDRQIDATPDVRTEGDVTIIPVVEERLVVSRVLYLREEIHVRRVERHEAVEVPVATRHQTVQIDRLGPQGPAGDPEQRSKDDIDDL